MELQSPRIIPFLWFDDQAEEAARFYVSLFDDSAIGETSRYNKEVSAIAGRPEGSVMTVSFRIAGHGFTAINGGPAFAFTPAISFFVHCDDPQQAQSLCSRLAEGGSTLMPFQRYPFSDGYAWVADRYGVSWQVNSGPRRQRLAPCLLFSGAQCGRAEQAMTLYTSLFPDSAIESVTRYGSGESPNTGGTVKQAVFYLGGQEFRAMDSALDHRFTFTEAISLQVHCDNQDEIDHLWARLADGGDPKAQQCGWLKDRFGVSWQIVPRVLFAMLGDADRRRGERVTHAFLQMKKFDIAALERAFAGD